MKTTRYRFEQSVQEVKEDNTSWLIDEFKSILESDKDFTRKCDYIGFSILSIDSKVESINEEIKELQTLKKNLKLAKELTLKTGATVFEKYGISKLEGAGISSITIHEPKPTSKIKLTIHNEYRLIEAGFYRKVIDEDAVLEFYNSGKCLETINANCSIEILRDIKAPKLKVNRRRGTTSNDSSSGSKLLGVAS
jgi:hypothetical protein